MSEPSAVALVLYDALDLLVEEEFDGAAAGFFGHPTAPDSTRQDERILFEEWLLFDWRDTNGRGLLERARDEPALIKEQREQCRQLQASNVYSYWQVMDTMRGYGITLEDVYTGQQYNLR